MILTFYAMYNIDMDYLAEKPIVHMGTEEDAVRYFSDEASGMDEKTLKELSHYEIKLVGYWDNSKENPGLHEVKERPTVFSYFQFRKDIKARREYREMKEDGKTSA